jgi:hypothetical protein
LPTKWLWNWLVPKLFGRPRVTLPEAFGLLIGFLGVFLNLPSGGEYTSEKSIQTLKRN